MSLLHYFKDIFKEENMNNKEPERSGTYGTPLRDVIQDDNGDEFNVEIEYEFTWEFGERYMQMCSFKVDGQPDMPMKELLTSVMTLVEINEGRIYWNNVAPEKQ